MLKKSVIVVVIVILLILFLVLDKFCLFVLVNSMK